jgi:hypothetical protein
VESRKETHLGRLDDDRSSTVEEVAKFGELVRQLVVVDARGEVFELSKNLDSVAGCKEWRVRKEEEEQKGRTNCCAELLHRRRTWRRRYGRKMTMRRRSNSPRREGRLSEARLDGSAPSLIKKGKRKDGKERATTHRTSRFPDSSSPTPTPRSSPSPPRPYSASHPYTHLQRHRCTPARDLASRAGSL